MLWKTHLTVTSSIGFPILYMDHQIEPFRKLVHASLLNEVTAIGVTSISIVGLLIGALLPDIDEPGSKISTLTTKLVNGIKNKIERKKEIKHGREKPLLIIRMINRVLGHRGAIHSIFGVFGLLILTNMITMIKPLHILFACITLGYGLHLLEDFPSYMGIKWFCPVWNKDFKVPYLLRYKVGGFKEMIIFIISILILVEEIGVIFMNFNIFKFIM